MTTETSIEIRRRLKARSVELGLDFQQAVLYYAMERFLFRLSRTSWSDRLVVKGAIMLRVWDAAVARPTRDIDFLGRVDNTPDAIRDIVAECLSIQLDDGLVFESEIHAVPITVEDRYPGVRVKVAGDLGGARFVLRLDVGSDDVVVPDPGWVDYPVLLKDQAPRILAYQPATAVAEKFQAMIEIGLANSRMKDYHDIWMLSRTLKFDGQDLADAVRATFERRGTELPAETPAELTSEYTGQPETSRMWDAYRRGLSGSAAPPPADLQDVADAIAAFVLPASTAAGDSSRLGGLTRVTIAYTIETRLEAIMRFVSIRDLRGKSAEVWKDLPEEREMVITSNGRPVAILAAVNESNLEESLSAFRRARAVEAVASLQAESARRGTDRITMEEIDNEITAVREKRAK